MNTLRATTSFRANEATAIGRENAIYKYSRGFDKPEEREAVVVYIDRLIKKYGPVVEGYPSWHPFTSVKTRNTEINDPQFSPQEFEGLDHTIYFRDAFITAPYGDADRIIKSTENKNNKYIIAEKIGDVKLYHYKATPVLVICDGIEKENDSTISKRFALANMLTNELQGWEFAECGERWEDMRRHILGIPCGSRSSLFVNQDTGQALREAFNLLNRHGVFGPVRY